VFYENSEKKLNRILVNNFAFSPKGFRPFVEALRSFTNVKLKIPYLIKSSLGYDKEVYTIDHHLSHAASAFFPSPHDDAVILTTDGVGEWATTTICEGNNNIIKPIYELKFPHSLGMLYSAFTYYAGFKVNSGEYKLMGLAPYGEPKYSDLIFEKIIKLSEDGSFKINMRYFDYCTGFKMINNEFCNLFGGIPRRPEAEISQKEMDIAKSIQIVLEEVILRLAKTARNVSNKKNLCMAGGVALNCVANGRLIREKLFDNIWIQPAAGDAGGALGCALYYWYTELNNKREVDGVNDLQKGSYLGPSYSPDEIKGFLDLKGCKYKYFEKKVLSKEIANLIVDKKVIGLFHGKMEYGPRALGNRSIIGDSRSSSMQTTMNLKIKYRESFRPFAPSVLEDRASELFEFPTGKYSPYMLFVANIKDNLKYPLTEEEKKLWGIDKLKAKRSKIPAITHVDYSARLQTVSKKTNPFYYDIISEFDKLTSFPVIINTSFNVRGEPIVCSFEDAYQCFLRTEMDFLVLENYLIDKKQQKSLEVDSDWRKEIPLD
jgi:carbamoyltransferase